MIRETYRPAPARHAPRLRRALPGSAAIRPQTPGTPAETFAAAAGAACGRAARLTALGALLATLGLQTTPATAQSAPTAGRSAPAAERPAPALAPSAAEAILSAKLRARLEAIADETPGVVAASIVDLTTGERFGVNDTLVLAQGSAIKIPILLELYRQAEAGRLRLDERLPIRAADRTGGSGVLQHFSDSGSALSLRDLAVLMIVLSDNTATNLLIDRVGMENVNRTLDELGLRRTRLQRKMIRPEDSAAGRENISTAAEAAALMARVGRCELPLSPGRCAEFRGILEIPKRGSFVEPVPGRIRVAWKPGGIEGVATAWGLVSLPGRPYAIAAMVAFGDDTTMDSAIRQIAAAAYDHFRRLAGATPYGTRVPPGMVPQGAGRE